MKKLGFGIIGCGVIHHWHADAIRRLADVADLVAVCDVAEDRAGAAAEKLGVTGYVNISDFLADGRIDIVTIATPSGMHADHAIEAVRRGKHVIVEKPFDISLDQADRLIAEAADADVFVTCISQTRYASGLKQLQEWIDAGKLGDLVYGEATIKWYRSQEYYDSGDWRGTWALDGGGALMNQGIHYADNLQRAMGKPKTVSAYAATRGHRIEVEDIVTASIVFENGALGSLTATTSAYPGFQTTLEIFGTKGSVRIENQEIVSVNFVDGEQYDSALLQSDTPSTASDPAAVGGYNHSLQFREFIDTVQSGKDRLAGALEGRTALEFVLGVYQSARTGQPVTFPL
ncbi:MAG: oxidoreductase domain protein [Capsulimonas sp.]|nr:oxidoreductase domain protein [Capsulimonas sp.]